MKSGKVAGRTHWAHFFRYEVCGKAPLITEPSARTVPGLVPAVSCRPHFTTDCCEPVSRDEPDYTAAHHAALNAQQPKKRRKEKKNAAPKAPLFNIGDF